MSYFHIKLEYFDTKLKSNQNLFKFDIDNIEHYVTQIVVPFLKHGEVVFNGTIINQGECRSLKFYKTVYPIEQCRKIYQSQIPPDVILVVHKEDVLDITEFSEDITDIVCSQASLIIQGQSSPIATAAKKPYKVFISHSSADKDFVSQLVELLEFIGLDNKTIFCTSVDGLGVPLNENICEYLRKQFQDYELFVIFVHSQSYYESTISLNEMGAAWALKTNHCSILTKDFDFDQMKGVVDSSKIAIKIDKDGVNARLNELKDKLIDIFQLPPMDSTAWERHRDGFLRNVR
jgi:hypothetical protein